MSYKGFTSVELKRPTRSTFDLSHENRLSTRIGKLTPIFISETMPNDTFYGSSEVLVKLAPMIAPIYHRLNMYVHYFFIPNRLLWDEWEPFITGGRLGEAVTSPPVPPRMRIVDFTAEELQLLNTGSLADYLGVPNIPDDLGSNYGDSSIDLMPFAAYYRAWYDYYRDRNYVADNTLLPLPSGEQAKPAITYMQNRCWEHDYFTSALPFTQRGSEVLMPIQGTGTVTYLAQSDVSAFDTGPLQRENATEKLVTSAGNPAQLRNIDEVTIDNSEITINELRRAVTLQMWLERNALAGSRYNESIMAHFGRKTSDARLQRAEYLGGGKAVIQISEVLNTAFSLDAEDNVVPPASMSGRGSTYANTNKFSYNCEEHGFIIGILSVMPTSGYMQGLPRMFQQRNTFLDYPWPTFAHLGEQEVYDSEIYLDEVALPDDRTQAPVFGYQSRYADWKYIPSSSHGDFRTTLDFWHLTRIFSSAPQLGNSFVTYDDANQDRIFNVTGVDTLWLYCYNKINVKRSLPYFGTPQLG
ncbi:MAG: major capsid protein [Arizlama microvirus]|nr:MAG: major capsid protein [Arizlama microvirus]